MNSLFLFIFLTYLSSPVNQSVQDFYALALRKLDIFLTIFPPGHVSYITPV